MSLNAFPQITMTCIPYCKSDHLYFYALYLKATTGVAITGVRVIHTKADCNLGSSVKAGKISCYYTNNWKNYFLLFNGNVKISIFFARRITYGKAYVISIIDSKSISFYTRNPPNQSMQIFHKRVRKNVGRLHSVGKSSLAFLGGHFVLSIFSIILKKCSTSFPVPTRMGDFPEKESPLSLSICSSGNRDRPFAETSLLIVGVR